MKPIKISLLVLTIGVLTTLVFTFPQQSQAQTITIDKPISEMTIPELQATIAEILQAIQQLQALLLQLTGEAPSISGIPSSYIFNTNLRYGISSNEVKYLQVFLNQDPDTRVSSTGWGSPGQESTYFGSKTRQAVIKFQAKYKNDISATVGYTIAGTGYVGPGTRTKINQLLEQYRTGTIPPTPPTPPTPGVECGPADNICPSGCTFSQDPDCTYCGDNTIQTPNSEGIHEVCDNTNLKDNTCISRGYIGGTLSCSNTCLTFNTTSCLSAGGGGTVSVAGSDPAPAPVQPSGPVCGNNTDNVCPSGCTNSQDTDCTYCGDNILQRPNNEGITEVCDNTSLNNETCSTQGFPGGTLQCSSTCLTFNTSQCTPPVPPNQDPVLDTIGDKSIDENQEISFTISGTDSNPEDTLSYSVQDIPTGATFTSQAFSWTPTYNQSGTYILTFTVSDSSLTDTEIITITVNNINRTPVLTAIGDKVITQNSALTFTISGTDPDNDSLTYSASDLPSGASFNTATRTFTWTPSNTGTYDTTFTVSDGSLTDTETIAITVSSLPQSNDPPEALNQNITFNEDNSVSITLSATDLDGDSLTYSIVSQPSQGAISGTLPNITYTPDANYNGEDSFTFKANDGEADSNTATVSLTINPVNDAPILNSIGIKSINENNTLTFTISAEDPDNDALYYSTQNSPNGASFNTTTRTFTWTPTFQQSGTYNVTFIISDSELTDSETITITVAEVCEPDTCQSLNYECGTVNDGCGGTISCGSCQSGYSCESGECLAEPGPAPYCGDGQCNGTESCSSCAQDCGTCPAGQTTRSITQFGITWYFDQNYTFGTFANGDYWVVNPAGGDVTIIAIDPLSTEDGGGRTRHGSMINPNPMDNIGGKENTIQGFDSRLNFWDAFYNKARPNGQDLSVLNPMIVPAGSSVVSTISRSGAWAWNLKDMALLTVSILTVLDQAPPTDSFRPTYVGDDKSIKFNKIDLNYSKLGNYNLVGTGLPELFEDSRGANDADLELHDFSYSLERAFQRPWIDFVARNSGSYIHPQYNMPLDGSNVARWHGLAGLFLNSDYTNLEKEELLIRYTQTGIDLYGNLQTGFNRTWLPDGQIPYGRKFPILFAGYVLNDPGMSGIGAKTGDYINAYGVGNAPADYIFFGEDATTFYVTAHPNSETDQQKRDIRTAGTDEDYDIYVSNPDEIPDGQTEYRMHTHNGWDYYGHSSRAKHIDYDEYLEGGYIAGTEFDAGAGHEGMPEWGIQHWVYRGDDGLDWTASYRGSNARNWAGFILSAYMMGMKDDWNHDALFDYVDRFVATQQALDAGGQSQRPLWVDNTWNAYRPSLDCYYLSFNSTTKTGTYNCSNELFDCNVVTDCSNYGTNQTALDYDPCNVGPCAGATPIENPPVLTSIGDRSVTVGNLLMIQPSATDPDGGVLTYSIQGLPAGAIFLSAGFFSWVPSQTGTYNVTFTVSDGKLQDSETITITVNPEVVIPPACEDGTCNGTETCSTCPQDCGSCVVTDSIIIGHTAVDMFDDIPQFYIDEVKKMSLDYSGESHSHGMLSALRLVEQQDNRFAVSVRTSGNPEADTDQHLRVYHLSVGEEDSWTNQTAINGLNSYLQTNDFDAFAFGWCWDMTWHNSPGGGVDPVYGARWAGSTVGGSNGDMRWGLDAGDTALTGNSVNLQNYLDAWDYYEQNNPGTAIIYSTGPVDSSGESGYQRYLKHEGIRDWVKNSQDRILFDYGNILTYNNAGVQNTSTWNGNTFPREHSENDGEYNPFGYGSGHLGEQGYLKIGKAMWVLLARLAGWDGTSSQQCSATNTSCGTYPNCENCNSSDGCSGVSYRNYYCSGTSCLYTEDDCSDCSCSCDSYNQTESTANNNCSDGIDNDCDGQTDMADSGCGCAPGQSQSCDTGEQGICGPGTQTCQSNSTWGSCIRNNDPTTENCTDSLDNDCDGTTDCSDTDCSTNPACATTIPTGYISWWKFEGNVNDSGPGNNNGTIYGDPQYATGAQGQGLEFDGDGDYVNLGDVVEVTGTAELTVSVWVKTPLTEGDDDIIIGKFGGGDDTFLLRYRTDDKIWWTVSNSIGTDAIAKKSGILSANVWHHVVGVYNGTNVLVYVNSVVGSEIGNLTGLTVYNPTHDLRIGDTGASTWNGTIDEVMIYDRALTESEIQDIYNAQKPGASPIRRISQTDEKLNNISSVLASIRSAIQDFIKKIQTLF